MGSKVGRVSAQSGSLLARAMCSGVDKALGLKFRDSSESRSSCNLLCRVFMSFYEANTIEHMTSGMSGSTNSHCTHQPSSCSLVLSLHQQTPHSMPPCRMTMLCSLRGALWARHSSNGNLPLLIAPHIATHLSPSLPPF